MVKPCARRYPYYFRSRASLATLSQLLFLTREASIICGVGALLHHLKFDRRFEPSLRDWALHSAAWRNSAAPPDRVGCVYPAIRILLHRLDSLL